MTLKKWNGFGASFINAASWSPKGAPQPGDTLLAASGTLTLRHARIDAATIQLTGAPADSPTLDIENVVLSRTCTVTAANDPIDLSRFAFAGTLRAAGWNTNLGTLTATSSDFQRTAQLEIDLTTGSQPHQGIATFVNAGTIACNPMGKVLVHAAAPGATLLNLGLISVAGHATLDAAITGTGTIRLGAAMPLHGFTATPDLTTTAAVGAGQTIAFLGGDVLHINDLGDFHGLITGFSATPTAGAQDRIELTGHDITGTIWNSNGTIGTLTLLEGTAVAGVLRFAGSHAANPFTLGHLNLVTATGVTPTTSLSFAPA
jgi:hypothetical protein